MLRGEQSAARLADAELSNSVAPARGSRAWTAGVCRCTRLPGQPFPQPPPEAMRGDDAAGSWEPGNETRPLPVAGEITRAERV